ncbi:hypothetical protein HYU90_00765 [Candidatus Collierbacteria bacterium]|nr:hypothetical protein [Candidatus Collierbacteria bacterium]
MTPYTLILVVTLIISPFAIILAQKQDKRTKSRLRSTLLLLLIGQTLLGLLNWKTLLLFLAISLLQIFLLTKKTRAETPTVFLNFINTFVFWAIMIRLDQKPISDPANLAGIAIAFIVLIGNLVGLLLINKDKWLRLKPLSHRGRFIFSLVLGLSVAVIFGFSYRNKSARNAAIAKVSALPEVIEYLREVPTGLVTLDHEDRETNSYLIHVYETKDGHTATFNWYTVDKTTGAITKDF